MAILCNLHSVKTATTVLAAITAFFALSAVVTSACTIWTCNTTAKNNTIFALALISVILGFTVAILKLVDTCMEAAVSATPKAVMLKLAHPGAAAPGVPIPRPAWSFLGDTHDLATANLHAT